MRTCNRHIRCGLFSCLYAGLLSVSAMAANATENGPSNGLQATREHPEVTYGALPLSFEANLGQSGASVKFLSRGRGYVFYLTDRVEAHLALSTSTREPSSSPAMKSTLAAAKSGAEPYREALLSMRLVGAQEAPQIEGLEELPGKANYFIGNDRGKWLTGVPTYGKVKLHEVYPGVDLVYYGNQRELEHDFVVAPRVDPGSIAIEVDGAERVSLDTQGSLILGMKDGQVRWRKPVAYQQVGASRYFDAAGFPGRSVGLDREAAGP